MVAEAGATSSAGGRTIDSTGSLRLRVAARIATAASAAKTRAPAMSAGRPVEARGAGGGNAGAFSFRSDRDPTGEDGTGASGDSAGAARPRFSAHGLQ